MSKVLDGMVTDDLNRQLAHAEEQADLAQYIDNWPRAQRERAYWQTIARQIRDEIDRREAQ